MWSGQWIGGVVNDYFVKKKETNVLYLLSPSRRSVSCFIHVDVLRVCCTTFYVSLFVSTMLCIIYGT